MNYLPIKIQDYLLEKFTDKQAIINYFDEISKDTLRGYLPIRLIDVTDEHIEAEMLVDERTCQTKGTLHGGASMALGETLGGFGSGLICPEGTFPVGLNITGNHLSMAKKGDKVRAIAKPIHLGRTTHLWQIDLHSHETGRLVSTIRITNSILQERKP